MHTEHDEDDAVADDVQHHVLRPVHRVCLAHVLHAVGQDRGTPRIASTVASAAARTAGPQQQLVGSKVYDEQNTQTCCFERTTAAGTVRIFGGVLRQRLEILS